VGSVEVRGLTKHFGDEVAVGGIDFDVPEGHFVTLLGPSGCGKTTTLRCLAGLELADAGDIAIAGECVASPTRGIWVPSEKRNIGMVFQSYAVWPHMTVFDNVAYGLRVRGMGRAEIAERTREALELVGLAGLAERFATRLSGGQQQRVALARALVYNPRVLLCDEPLSNLDAKLREQMRLELTRLQHDIGITTVYVTHDQSEALVMSDTIIVMDHGHILQQGDPETIYAAPTNRFVADFIGLANLLPVRVMHPVGSGEEAVVETAWGRPYRFRCQASVPLAVGTEAVLSVRPEDITLGTEAPSSSDNVLAGQVRDTIYLGNFLDCRVEVDGREIRIQLYHDGELPRGTPVYLTCPAAACRCLPA
jgi:iron(III) transport system ATP-binding protein